MSDYILGSFNMYKFSDQGGPETKKSYNAITRIIREAKFDLIAMQEVFSKKALSKLIDVMNDTMPECEWDFSWDEPKKTKNKQAREGYAFVWNKKRLDKVAVRLDDGTIRTFEPRIVNQYKKSIMRLGKKELMRNPYYGRFAPKNSRGESYGFELRIINAHIMYSSSTEDEGKYDESDIKMRKGEYALLSHVVLPKIDLKEYGLYEEDDSGVKTHLNACTILMGDYNLNIKNGINPSPHLPDLSERENDYLTYAKRNSNIVTMQEQKTTFKQEMLQMVDGIYKNNYDHFTYDEKEFEYYNIGSDTQRINVVENNIVGINIPISESFNGNYKEYKEKVSDHLPVRLKLTISH